MASQNPGALTAWPQDYERTILRPVFFLVTHHGLRKRGKAIVSEVKGLQRGKT